MPLIFTRGDPFDAEFPSDESFLIRKRRSADPAETSRSATSTAAGQAGVGTAALAFVH
jgi:hypothetical protein